MAVFKAGDKAYIVKNNRIEYYDAVEPPVRLS